MRRVDAEKINSTHNFTRYLWLYFYCDSGLCYWHPRGRTPTLLSAYGSTKLSFVYLIYRKIRELIVSGFFLIQNLGQQSMRFCMSEFLGPFAQRTIP